MGGSTLVMKVTVEPYNIHGLVQIIHACLLGHCVVTGTVVTKLYLKFYFITVRVVDWFIKVP